MAKIVVGVDGSAGSQAALSWAVEEARIRGAELFAVHAWDLPLAPGEPTTYAPVGEPAAEHDLEAVERTLDAAAEDALQSSLGGIDASGVVLRIMAVKGSAVDALLEQAADADLLVVGSRGRGGFKGLVLGSVSQRVAHHAPCPVVIVRGE